MYYNVRETRYLRDFIVWLKFEDGTEGEIDLSSELCGPIFEPLKESDYFGKVSVAEYGTISWPNGADIAPEFLYERIRPAINESVRAASGLTSR